MNIEAWATIQSLRAKYGEPTVINSRHGQYQGIDDYLYLHIASHDRILEVRIYPHGTMKSLTFYMAEKGAPIALDRAWQEGPAYESYYPNGVVAAREYRKVGKAHRPIEDGPAFEYFDSRGEKTNVWYYENGREVILYS
jgi:hypothetical protein